jgi:hypothetical protein
VTSLWDRAFGVVRRPRVTFATIVTAPTWVSALVTTTIVTFVCSAGFLLSPVGQQALVDQWERTAVAFGQTVDDATYDRMDARVARPGVRLAYATATTLATGPAATLALAMLLRVVLNRTTGRQRSLREVLAVVSHAGFVLALRQIVATPVDYVRESITSPTTLVQFFSMLDETSPVARVLGAIDLLVVWWLVVLAVGLSVLYPRSARRLTLVFAGAYLIVALLAALTMAASGGVA